MPRGEDALEPTPAQQARRAVARVDEQQPALGAGGAPVEVDDDTEARRVADLGAAEVQAQLARTLVDDRVDRVADVGHRVDVETPLDDDIVAVGCVEHSDRTPAVGVQRHVDPSQRCAVTMMTPQPAKTLPLGVKKWSRKYEHRAKNSAGLRAGTERS